MAGLRQIPPALPVLGLTWCMITGVCLHALFVHAYEPAAVHAVRNGWPASSAIERPSARRQVVLFAHPACPCTAASLQKLAEIVERLPGIDATVVFVTRGLPPALGTGGTAVRVARELPQIQIVFDAHREAEAFQATVSGEAFAFHPDGSLLFHGGLTAGRGHAGDSESARQLEAALRGDERAVRECPVYGCRLP